MSVAQFTKGHSTRLYYGEVNTDPATEVAQIQEMEDLPNVKAEIIDVSTMTSDDQYAEKTAGWKDVGSIKGTCLYTRTSYAAMLALIAQDKRFKVLFVDGSFIYCNGILVDVGAKVTRKGVVTFSFEIQASGKINSSIAS